MLTGPVWAAAATTPAADILPATPPAAANPQIYCIAPPRVGDQSFVKPFNAKVINNNFRIYNKDPAITCPQCRRKTLGYVHVNTAPPQPELDSWQCRSVTAGIRSKRPGAITPAG